ncbi:transferrin-like [Hyposmocoma kahamanoa]|uniref:transferrin-like n=1 Tax=Hyposmocoma kahamanoa TaxID=1477025 RepID=UPI000E6D8367|nr:transferrin-like [Hyposmocoma kahamanoa]
MTLRDMGFLSWGLVLFLAATASAQTQFTACVRFTEQRLCRTLEATGSQVACSLAGTNVDCALRLARNEVDFGVFTEEEVLLMGQRQINVNHVVATIRDAQRIGPTAFEAVAIVPATYSGGLTGFAGARYCHPGLDQTEQRWSPRVLKGMEYVVGGTDRCPQANTNQKTAEEMEVEILSNLFVGACRPGQWSANATVDADLKRRYPNLCSLCGPNSNCDRYTIDMGAPVPGVDNNNRHIQALECLRRNSNQTTVAYVAWQHVVEYFGTRNPDQIANFAVLCPGGSVEPLPANILGSSSTAPCSFVRQPWKSIVANSNAAANLVTNMRNWWPQGSNPGGSTWQATLFDGIIGGSNARVFFDDVMPSPTNYTAELRVMPTIDSTATCIPSRRWCVTSQEEFHKCSWVQAAAHSLGIQPPISCVSRSSVLHCLKDIADNLADFMAIQANYGYIARQHYNLSSVKLVQNSFNNENSTSRVAAFIKNSQANEITRFENLRNKRACFPEYGGLAYVAFVRTAQERGVISPNECDYAKAVGEFFESACAPGAIDAAHVISATNYNATNLCTVCRPTQWHTPTNTSQVFCAWDHRNQFFGNNGSLACLADPNTHVAFLQIGNIESNLAQLSLQANQFRALCRNNSLAANPGVNIDSNCLLAHVVDMEVLTRRNDPLSNALSVLLDNLEDHFGYAVNAPLIDLEIFSPFDGVSNLLFKDSVMGLAEPSSNSQNELARNYFELFNHLDRCNGSPGAAPGIERNFFMIITLLVMTFMARIVV